jgi:hypothetical protein
MANVLKAVDELTGWKGLVILAGVDPRDENKLNSRR